MKDNQNKKMTYHEMHKAMYAHNVKNGINTQFGNPDKRIYGVIVYKASNWPDKDYSLESRSYRVSCDNKCFIPGMGGNSLFGSSLDESDICVRLDYQTWEVDYCYIEDRK